MSSIVVLMKKKLQIWQNITELLNKYYIYINSIDIIEKKNKIEKISSLKFVKLHILYNEKHIEINFDIKNI